MNFEIADSQTHQPAFAYDQPTFQNHYGSVEPLRSGLAITSMVLGIVGIVTSFFLVGFLLALVGLILGIVALSRNSKMPSIYGGRGFAIAGIVTSISAFALLIPIVAAVAIPNLMASRQAANEASAISNLRTIYSAQQAYQAIREQPCADLRALATEGLIDKVLSTGQKSGYKFEVSSEPDYGCEVFATPVGKSAGRRSYVISFDGIMRSAENGGFRADRNDPAL